MEPFIGEIKLMATSQPPKNWALCNGAILSIQQNQALFSLLGTMYGGNGTTNFALPDLRGRAIVHRSSASPQGLAEGSETVTLGVANLPQHNHMLLGTSAAASTTRPTGSYFANDSAAAADFLGPYDGAVVSLAPDSLAPTGGNQPHDNMQPYLVLNYFIALFGIYPSRS